MIFLPVRILWYKKMANIFPDYILIISQINTLVKFFVGTSVTKFKTLSHRRILIFCTITPTSHSWLFGMWAKNIPLEFVYTGVSASPAYCSSSEFWSTYSDSNWTYWFCRPISSQKKYVHVWRKMWDSNPQNLRPDNLANCFPTIRRIFHF